MISSRWLAVIAVTLCWGMAGLVLTFSPVDVFSIDMGNTSQEFGTVFSAALFFIAGWYAGLNIELNDIDFHFNPPKDEDNGE